MTRILIVEDEDAIARGLKFNFEQEGYQALVATDGEAALAHFEDEAEEIDVVILDLMLPGMSGYDICDEIRRRNPGVPIIVLSARTLSEDKVRAFNCGTDQYMTKPFALPELLSRVRNLVERRQHRQMRSHRSHAADVPQEYRFDDVTVNFRTFELTARGETARLTTMEMHLLRYFIEHEGDVLSRAQILEDVWDQSPDVTTRSIDNFVMRLRRYFEVDPARPRHLVSVRGTGYRFVAEGVIANDHEEAT